jgi:two-component system sensor histidine kinase DegS
MPQSNSSLSSTLTGKPFSDYLEGILADAGVETQKFAAGETVFLEGDPGGSAFFIRSGSVDVFGTGPDGEKRLLNHLRCGELFGEMALLDQTRRSASALTRERAELFVFTRDELMTLLTREPQMALWMLGLASHRLRVLTRLVSQMEQVHEVNLKILAAQEEERRRIGRDIHDGVAQSFAASILALQSAVQLLDRDPNRARSALLDLEDGLRDSLGEIRELIRNLFPKELRNAGLVGAIDQFLERATWMDDLDVSFKHRGMDDELPAALEANLYCIVQEALSNVKRHASASKVRLEIHHEGGQINMLIADDGRGFDIDATPADGTLRNGYGLLSMEERARLAGGTMELDSRPEGGTRLRFRIPVPGCG